MTENAKTDTKKAERIAGAWAPVGNVPSGYDFLWHRPNGLFGNAVEVSHRTGDPSVLIVVERPSGERQHTHHAYANAHNALFEADQRAKLAAWTLTGGVPYNLARPGEAPTTTIKDETRPMICVVTPEQVARFTSRHSPHIRGHESWCSRVSGPVHLSASVNVETGCCGECGAPVAPTDKIASAWEYSATPKPSWTRKTNKGDVLAIATRENASGYMFTCSADGVALRTGYHRSSWSEAMEAADQVLVAAGWILTGSRPDEVRWTAEAWEKEISLSGLDGPRWVRRTRGRGTHGLCVEVTPRRDGAEGFVFHFPDPRHIEAFSTLGEALRAADEVAAGRGWTLTGGLPAEFEGATAPSAESGAKSVTKFHSGDELEALIAREENSRSTRRVAEGWAQAAVPKVCDFAWERGDGQGGAAADVTKMKMSVVFGVRVRTKSGDLIRPADTFASLEQACRAADKLAEDLGWEIRSNGLLDYITSPRPVAEPLLLPRLDKRETAQIPSPSDLDKLLAIADDTQRRGILCDGLTWGADDLERKGSPTFAHAIRLAVREIQSMHNRLTFTGASADSVPKAAPSASAPAPLATEGRVLCVITPERHAQYLARGEPGVVPHRTTCGCAGKFTLPAYVDVATGCCTECGAQIGVPNERDGGTPKPAPLGYRLVKLGEVLDSNIPEDWCLQWTCADCAQPSNRLKLVANPGKKGDSLVCLDCAQKRATVSEGCHGCMDGGKSEHSATCPTHVRFQPTTVAIDDRSIDAEARRRGRVLPADIPPEARAVAPHAPDDGPTDDELLAAWRSVTPASTESQVVRRVRAVCTPIIEHAVARAVRDEIARDKAARRG